MQLTFHLGAFEVFWPSKRSTVQKDERLGLQLLHPPALPQPQALPPPTPTTAINDAHFTILQWNANGTGNKIAELLIFMEKHYVKVAVIQESKLSQTSSTPLHPEVHHSQKGPLSWPRRWFTHLCTQVDKFLSRRSTPRRAVHFG